MKNIVLGSSTSQSLSLSSVNEKNCIHSSQLESLPSLNEKKHIDQSPSQSLSSIKPTRKTNRKINCVVYDLLTDQDCKYYCGLSKKTISILCKKCKIKKEIYCIMFFTKVRHAWAGEIVGLVFGFSGKYALEIFDDITKSLYNMFGKEKMSSTYWTRERINANTPIFCKKILDIKDDEIGLQCDGFPIYIQKSGTMSFQKKTYSNKCNDNVLNMHGIQTLNGKIISIQGPFFGNGHNNDEWIMNAISDEKYIQNMENIFNSYPEQCEIMKNVFGRKGDKMYADRGM